MPKRYFKGSKKVRYIIGHALSIFEHHILLFNNEDAVERGFGWHLIFCKHLGRILQNPSVFWAFYILPDVI